MTFEQFLELAGPLINDIREIKGLLAEKSKDPDPEPDHWYDIADLCSYLPDKPVRATIYEKVQKRKIPFRRSGKKLIFLKSEIDEWLRSGRQKTYSEISAQADEYLTKKKGLVNGR